MRQEGLSAKQVLQQAKIQDLESAIDSVPAEALVGPATSWASKGFEPIATSRPESAAASEVPKTPVEARAANPEEKLADDVEPISGEVGPKRKNRFLALVMEDSDSGSCQE